MLKVKFKKMLKESGEQTDKDDLAVIRTEFSKRVPNLDLVLNLAKDNEILKAYVDDRLQDLGILEQVYKIHQELSKETPNLDLILNLAKDNEILKAYVGDRLKDRGILDKLKEIDMKLSEETPNFLEIIMELSNNEASINETLIAYYNQNEVFKEGCYRLGIQEINRLILENGSAYSEGLWEEAWDAVSYDPQGEIEYALEVRLRLAKYYIERLGEVIENPVDVLTQLTNIEDQMQDLREYRITILYKFLNEDLMKGLEDAIQNLVSLRYEELDDIRDYERSLPRYPY